MAGWVPWPAQGRSPWPNNQREGGNYHDHDTAAASAAYSHCDAERVRWPQPGASGGRANRGNRRNGTEARREHRHGAGGRHRGRRRDHCRHGVEFARKHPGIGSVADLWKRRHQPKLQSVVTRRRHNLLCRGRRTQCIDGRGRRRPCPTGTGFCRSLRCRANRGAPWPAGHTVRQERILGRHQHHFEGTHRGVRGLGGYLLLR